MVDSCTNHVFKILELDMTNNKSCYFFMLINRQGSRCLTTPEMSKLQSRTTQFLKFWLPTAGSEHECPFLFKQLHHKNNRTHSWTQRPWKTSFQVHGYVPTLCFIAWKLFSRMFANPTADRRKFRMSHWTGYQHKRLTFVQNAAKSHSGATDTGYPS